MIKQCTSLLNLLDDPVPFVRIEVIEMIGHILTHFIDFIPSRQSQIFLAMLIQRLSKGNSLKYLLPFMLINSFDYTHFKR